MFCSSMLYRNEAITTDLILCTRSVLQYGMELTLLQLALSWAHALYFNMDENEAITPVSWVHVQYGLEMKLLQLVLSWAPVLCFNMEWK